MLITPAVWQSVKREGNLFFSHELNHLKMLQINSVKKSRISSDFYVNNIWWAERRSLPLSLCCRRVCSKIHSFTESVSLSLSAAWKLTCFSFFFFFLRKIRLLCRTSCNEEREREGRGKKGKVDFTGNDDAAVWKSFCLIKKKKQKKKTIITKQLQNNSCKYSLVEQICNEEFNWCPRCFQMFSVRKSSLRNSIRTCCESVSRHELDWVIFSSFHPNMTVNMPEKFYGKF